MLFAKGNYIMMKVTNVQYWNFKRRFEFVKALKRQETCLEQKKVARNPKSCSKVAQQLMDSPSLKGGPGPSQFKKVATISYIT